MQEYEIIDLDRNGELSPWEHATYLKCRGASAKDARKSYAAVDSNCDGVIDPYEFTSGARGYFNADDENSASKLFYGQII